MIVWLESEAFASRAHGLPVARQKAATVARATGVPPMLASRVLAVLQRHGLLVAFAGRHGGYDLGRPSDRISLLEIVEAIDGPVMTRTCLLRDGLCADSDPCGVHDAWRGARAAFRDVLDRYPLSEVVATSLERTAGQVGQRPATPHPIAVHASPGVSRFADDLLGASI